MNPNPKHLIPLPETQLLSNICGWSEPWSMKPNPSYLMPHTWTRNTAAVAHMWVECVLRGSCYPGGAPPLPQAGTPSPHQLFLHPTPRHPTPDTLQPTPYTLHFTTYTLHPTPYTLHPAPYTLRPTHVPGTRNQKPETKNQTPETKNPEPHKLLTKYLHNPSSWCMGILQTFNPDQSAPPKRRAGAVRAVGRVIVCFYRAEYINLNISLMSIHPQTRQLYFVGRSYEI